MRVTIPKNNGEAVSDGRRTGDDQRDSKASPVQPSSGPNGQGAGTTLPVQEHHGGAQALPIYSSGNPKPDPLVCSICGQGPFKSRSGLGVHRTAKHKETVHAEVEARVDAKAAAKPNASGNRQWTPAEEIIMAEHEATLLLAQPNMLGKEINISIGQKLGRSDEAVKRRRQRAEYKVLAASIKSRTAAGESDEPNQGDTPPVEPTAGEPPEVPQLSQVIRSLIHSVKTSTDPIIKALANAYLDTRSEDGLVDIPKTAVSEAFSQWMRVTFPGKERRETRKKGRKGARRRKRRRPPGSQSNHTKGMPQGGEKGREEPALNKPAGTGKLTRAQRRSRARWKSQTAFRSNAYQAGKKTLNGEFDQDFEESSTAFQPKAEHFKFWGALFSTASTSDRRKFTPTTVHWEILEPVSPAEVQKALGKSKDNTPGPDRLTKGDLQKLDPQVLADWFNLFLATGYPPEELLKGTVSLIPKVDAPKVSTDLRPITVSSKFLRTFHSIMASRMDRHLELPVLQRGFRTRVDGCADNLWILRNLIKSKSRNFEPLSIGLCDLKNAFGSCSHDSILVACHRLGVPAPLVNYIRESLTGFTVSFKGDSANERYQVRAGVLQGDPLSSVIFNCVMALVCCDFTPQVGVKTPGGVSVPYVCYADDTVLLGDNHNELSILSGDFERAAGKCGMRMNAKKCATLSLRREVSKTKRIYVDSKSFIRFNDEPVPAMHLAETYKYLGLKVSSNGVETKPIFEGFVEKLKRISRARIDPGQRLFTLRQLLIPQYHHALVLGGSGLGLLDRLDKAVRKQIRTWLHLPHDTPLGAFHAKAKDGGLEIPCLKLEIPRLRAWRFGNLETFHPLYRLVIADPVCNRAFSVDSEYPKREGSILCDRRAVQLYWANKLQTSIDGMGLKNANCSPLSHKWVTSAYPMVSASEFIKGIHVRLAVLKTNLRASRGNRSGQGKACRACGPTVNESLGHILQQCYMSHGLRTKRHNTLVDLVSKFASRKGWSVLKEPVINKPRPPDFDTTSQSSLQGSLKPDLLIYRRNKVFIVDPTVIADGDPKRPGVDILAERDLEKIEKYDNELVRDFCADLLGRPPDLQIRVAGLAVTWRGVISPGALKVLIDRSQLGLSHTIATFLAVRTLVGGWRIWNGRKVHATA